MRHPSSSRSLAALAAIFASVACGEQYCQSGPKYGMQCYDINSTEYQETQVRGETVSERYEPGPGHPVGAGVTGPERASPGCAVLSDESGRHWVMSEACQTRREPAYGAVR
jgi:hypothetical protein